jgi:heme/copper-type cytochrome/quinol oxidase subunit 2
LLAISIVGLILGAIIKNFESYKSPISNKYLNHGTLIPWIWTITSALILVLIAFPSFKLLDLMDEVTDTSLSVLAEDHQWYWSYEYPEFLNGAGDFVEFDFCRDDNIFCSSRRMYDAARDIFHDQPTSNPPNLPSGPNDPLNRDIHDRLVRQDYANQSYIKERKYHTGRWHQDAVLNDEPKERVLELARRSGQLDLNGTNGYQTKTVFDFNLNSQDVVIYKKKIVKADQLLGLIGPFLR